MKNYLSELNTEKCILKDLESNWDKDIDLAIEKASTKYNYTNRKILNLLPLDKFVEYLIHTKIIPDINRYSFIDEKFNIDWLDSIGNDV